MSQDSEKWEKTPEDDDREDSVPNFSAKSFLILAIALGVLLLLVYEVKPLLRDAAETEPEKEKSTEEPARAVSDEIAEDLTTYADQLIEQITSHRATVNLQKSSEISFVVKHLLRSKDGEKLLADVQKTVVMQPDQVTQESHDIVFTRDEFGRYVASFEGCELKLYPPVPESQF